MRMRQNVTIGERISDYRSDRKWSQPKLAQELEKIREETVPCRSKQFDRNDVENWENNRKNITAIDVYALATVFGVDCNTIITGVSAENETVLSELGLSNTAIELLKKHDPDVLRAINRMLDSDLIGLLIDIEKFIDTDFEKEVPEDIKDTDRELYAVMFREHMAESIRKKLMDTNMKRFSTKKHGGMSNG